MGVVTTMAAALAQGVVGYAEDIAAEAHRWTFDPGGITAPTVVYHGVEDTVVPIAHGRHTAELIPGARLTTWPADGHLSLLGHVSTVIADLTADDRCAATEATP